MRIRKRPVDVDGWQWDGSWEDAHRVVENIHDTLVTVFRDADGIAFSIHTLEGKMRVSPDDWVIRGVNGEYYPCKPDIFEKTYERLDA